MSEPSGDGTLGAGQSLLPADQSKPPVAPLSDWSNEAPLITGLLLCANSHRASSPVFLGNQTATDCRQLLVGEGRLPAATLARHLDEAWFGEAAIARVRHSWRSLLGDLDGQPWRMEDATQSINAQETDL